MDTKQVSLLARPGAGSFPVVARHPIPQFRTMTLTAQDVRLGKIDRAAIRKVQLIAIDRIVAIQAPPIFGVVLENDILVIFQEAPSPVHVFPIVTVGTGKDSIGKRRRRDGHEVIVVQELIDLNNRPFLCL